MDYHLFKIAGAVAGVGGIAIASVVYIFREVIRREIFPQLTSKQAYGLLNRIVVLIFIIGVLGILAYIVVNWRSESHAGNIPNHSDQTPTPAPVKTALSGTVVDQNERPLQGVKVTLDDLPGMVPIETSSDGVFNLKEIPKKYGEMVRLRIIAEGYQPNPYTEDVELGKAPPVITVRKGR
jgi:hypothetical protein